ncbi:uncharacterized protein [Procambarus clarkii]|uniref:uncharacterized protein n=1 Tax=Procambarus clarkii TaxID=6728 RepID=UPI001E673D9F|nr:uncharacterized protein LOC123773378 [Procambarus clarkii]XP_045623050.1 uncharacterized protein LOC123773378 [Procambarus clarkii]
MDFRSTEKLVPCPYDPSHTVQPHRLAIHIVKCKRNHPDMDMVPCHYNATHVLPSSKIKAHELECAEKHKNEVEFYQKRETCRRLQSEQHVIDSRNRVLVPPVINQGDLEEDWDNDLVESSYDPTKSMLLKKIARKPPAGLSRSGKLDWRTNEIERVQALENRCIKDITAAASGENHAEHVYESYDAEGGINISDEAAGHYIEMQQADVPLHHLEVEPHSHNAMTLTGSVNGASDQSGNNFEQTQSLDIDEYKRRCINKKLKLTKKLLQINKLEQKRDAGILLLQQEQAKIAKKQEFETELSEVLKNLKMF